MRIKIVGVGGIGCWLLRPLLRFLNFGEEKAFVTLIDGDTYEQKNLERQDFPGGIGNKAEVQVEKFRSVFPGIELRAQSEYVKPESIEYLIEDGDIIFLCVDNHKTRSLFSEFCEEMEDIVLISGGNEYTDGNIQVHVREDDDDVTLPIANRFHPEIQEPEDRSPHEMSCEELAADSASQLIFMNFAIASSMLNAFYAQSQGLLKYDEA
ncbi:ThiF family adenylyltransferase, partial [Patescibacteria group bacterium]